MTNEEIKKDLELHQKWLKNKEGGKKLDWSGKDLRGANLYGADLRCADLQYADLQGANLQYANLRCANLQGANLQDANLRDADLQDANLRYADLQRADLQGANLQYADLQGANLRNASLQFANLRYADLRGATFDRGELWVSQSQILPEGKIYGYKKVENNIVLKLEIPEESLRVNAIGSRKCRTNLAKVVEAYGAPNTDCEFSSRYDSTFKYKVGEIITCPDYDPDIRVECSSGIHFFITRKEAEEYT